MLCVTHVGSGAWAHATYRVSFLFAGEEEYMRARAEGRTAAQAYYMPSQVHTFIPLHVHASTLTCTLRPRCTHSLELPRS